MTRARAPSQLVGMDVVKTPARLTPATSALAPPKVARESGSPDVPPLFIVSVGCPCEEPSVWKTEKDGETYNCVFYFALRPETTAALAALTAGEAAGGGGAAAAAAACPAAVRLLREYCRQAPRDEKFRGRVKAIAHIVNFDELGLPSWLKGYNAKPVLIQKSGAVHVGPDFIEMDVDIRGWSILSKQGLFTLFPHFKDILVEIGFVIEGRDDDEMPEARARARARLALPRPRRARASLRRRAPSLLRPTPIQAMLGCNLFNIDPTTVRPIGAVGPDDMSGKAEC